MGPSGPPGPVEQGPSTRGPSSVATRTSTLTKVLVAAGALMALAATPPDLPSEGPSGSPGAESPAQLPEQVDLGPASTRPAAAPGDPLVGTFTVDPGRCETGPVTAGSYFRMVQPGGEPASGPYVDNGDSPCADDSYTPLRPGSDGGLRTGEHQPHPDPAFDGSGNALADRITQPQSFFGTRFSTATNPVDPQTGTQVGPPQVGHDGAGNLTGDLRAFAAAWNGQHFNQGSPKPDGSRPSNTAGPTGTYDPDTGRYTLRWSSRIQGGPFDNFTGVWHLEGTFESDGAAGASSADRDADASTSGASDTGDTGGQRSDGTSDQSGRLADTGPGLAPGLALALLAAAAALTRRSRR